MHGLMREGRRKPVLYSTRPCLTPALLDLTPALLLTPVVYLYLERLSQRQAQRLFTLQSAGNDQK
ncbi:hypothetical protein ACCAA_1790002 [Candidatus Accumulibacter aalborgensis]|uniref:Uncharacterized protein n=1 Tax=Candidatus Accumulibacter aalborgensis TaxID=1860102 RepID=A0A1A8XHM3_9PROT|nr:hypothetical protein ACCAA_1790002 [Candidatus Accumulibacter aalborgensis]